MKKNVKKLKVLSLIFALLFSITGCASNTNDSSETYVDSEIVKTIGNNESLEGNTFTDVFDVIYTNSGTIPNMSDDTKMQSNTRNAANVQSSTKTENNTSNAETVQSKISTPNTQIKNDSAITEPKEEIEKEESSKAENILEKNNTPSTSNTQTSSKPSSNKPRFTEPVYKYEYDNIKESTPYGNYYAWMRVYCVNDNTTNRANFKNEFKRIFGYEPTAEIQIEFVGEYLVDDYVYLQRVYEYSIKDSTYPLITDEFYVIKKKICSDGSGWCGFPVPCSMDDMDNSQRVQDLKSKMRKAFCEWYGVDYLYIVSNQDKFMVNMISELGVVRTTDGRILDAIYHYMRGVNMPVEYK